MAGKALFAVLKELFFEMAKLLLILCFYYLKYIFDNCLKSINNEMMKYMT